MYEINITDLELQVIQNAEPALREHPNRNPHYPDLGMLGLPHNAGAYRFTLNQGNELLGLLNRYSRLLRSQIGVMELFARNPDPNLYDDLREKKQRVDALTLKIREAPEVPDGPAAPPAAPPAAQPVAAQAQGPNNANMAQGGRRKYKSRKMRKSRKGRKGKKSGK